MKNVGKIVCALMLLAPGLALAQQHSVEPASAMKQAKPAKPTVAVGVTLDAQGRLWLARVDHQQLLVSRSDDGGAHFSAPVQVTPSAEMIAADGESRPKIAVSRDGTVLLTWTQALPQNYSGNIRFSRSVDGGKTFSTPITLNDDGRVTSHRFDALAIDGAGRVAVVWLDARDRDAATEKASARDRDAATEKTGGRDVAGKKSHVFSGVSVYTAQSNDNGAQFVANRRLTAHTCECCRTALTWSGKGPVALWRNLFDVNTRDFAVAYLDGGRVQRATDDNWQIDACPHHGGDIAADANGVLHLVWFTSGTARQGLFYKRIAGETASTPMPLGNAAAQAGHASVAAVGNQVLISWREFNGKAYTVHAMRSDDGGGTWGVPVQLAEAAGVADYPVSLTDGARALVVWNAVAEGLRVLPVAPGAQQ